MSSLLTYQNTPLAKLERLAEARIPKMHDMHKNERLEAMILCLMDVMECNLTTVAQSLNQTTPRLERTLEECSRSLKGAQNQYARIERFNHANMVQMHLNDFQEDYQQFCSKVTILLSSVIAAYNGLQKNTANPNQLLETRIQDFVSTVTGHASQALFNTEYPACDISRLIYTPLEDSLAHKSHALDKSALEISAFLHREKSAITNILHSANASPRVMVHPCMQGNRNQTNLSNKLLAPMSNLLALCISHEAYNPPQRGFSGNITDFNDTIYPHLHTSAITLISPLSRNDGDSNFVETQVIGRKASQLKAQLS